MKNIYQKSDFSKQLEGKLKLRAIHDLLIGNIKPNRLSIIRYYFN